MLLLGIAAGGRLRSFFCSLTQSWSLRRRQWADPSRGYILCGEKNLQRLHSNNNNNMQPVHMQFIHCLGQDGSCTVMSHVVYIYYIIYKLYT